MSKKPLSQKNSEWKKDKTLMDQQIQIKPHRYWIMQKRRLYPNNVYRKPGNSIIMPDKDLQQIIWLGILTF